MYRYEIKFIDEDSNINNIRGFNTESHIHITLMKLNSYSNIVRNWNQK